MLYHGISDELLLFKNAELSYKFLFEAFKDNLQYQTEEGLGHTLSPDGFKAMETFMKEKMK